MASGDIYTLFEMKSNCDRLLKRYGHEDPAIFCAVVSTMLDEYFIKKHIPMEEGWKMLIEIASRVHAEFDMED